MSNERSVIPTVSRALPDGTLVELLYNGEERTTALAVSRPEGRVSVEPFLDLASDERLVPYQADQQPADHWLRAPALGGW